jgi:subtilisin family serine protease
MLVGLQILMAFFFNLDIFAPGTQIMSLWTNGGVNLLSGTSCAAAHVAGLVAYFVSVRGNQHPNYMKEYIKELATRNALDDIPDGTLNYLAFNGFGV